MDIIDQPAIGWPLVALRLGLAAVLVIPLGFDRELRDKAAGLRSYMLASVAAGLFALITIELTRDPAIASSAGGNPFSVVKAVAEAAAVLAAGTMIAKKGSIIGVTTGIGLWLAAAIGLAAGFGAYGIAIAAAFGGILIVTLLRLMEKHWLNNSE